MIRRLFLAAILTPSLALAAPDHQAVAERTLAQVTSASAGFAAATEALRGAAPAACEAIDAEVLQTRFHAAWDAWMALHPMRFGPLEDEDRALQIAFWPDSRGTTGRTVSRALKSQNLPLDDPSAFGNGSVASRGFYALERLLFNDDGAIPLTDPYRCRYVAAVAVDLDRLADEIAASWAGPWGTRVSTAGAPGNDTYLAADEVSLRLFASLTGSLDETIKTRITVPLGSFQKPKPRVAEARRSGRSLQQIALNTQAVGSAALTIFGPELSSEAVGQIEAALAAVEDSLADLRAIGMLPEVLVSDQLKVEILGQKVTGLNNALRATVGPGLGIAEGFNSADGD
ncbi:MAG: imelysin family protein [Pseudomonadota bacterium]